MSKILHINIDDILSGWKSSCTYKDDDGDYIEKCSVGRIARWGAHYIAVIHDDVPAGERKEIAEFIADAPKRITELEKELEQHKAITEAAKFLVKVKSRKDTQVARYLASWPIALRKIEEALAQLPEEGE